MNHRYDLIRVVFGLAAVATFVFSSRLHHLNGIFWDFTATLLLVPWLLMFCLCFWCGVFLYLTFVLSGVWLVGFLLTAVTACFLEVNSRPVAHDVSLLLIGVLLGKGALFFREWEWKDTGKEWVLGQRLGECAKAEALYAEMRGQRVNGDISSGVYAAMYFELHNFLLGVLGLLTFSALWHWIRHITPIAACAGRGPTFGLTTVCSPWPRLPFSGFCWNWVQNRAWREEGRGLRIEDGVNSLSFEHGG